jgi:hypothetical protein
MTIIYCLLGLNFICLLILLWKVHKQDYFIGSAAYKAKCADENCNNSIKRYWDILNYFNLVEFKGVIKKKKGA